MKTKDFIKMLQEADPEGEAYIRMGGGIPIGAELKAGYWDGPFAYLDENNNYVYSIEENKVDIYCQDLEGFVWDNVSQANPNELPSWENIKKKFIFKINGYSIKEQREERINSILVNAKKHYDDVIKFEKESLEKHTKESVSKYNKGWRFFQNKKVDLNETPNMHVYYTWLIEEPGKTNIRPSSCIADVEGILFSGLFEKLDNNKKEGYYEWILKK